MKFCTTIYSKNKKLHSNERKLNTKLETFTLIILTNTFNLVSNIYNVKGQGITMHPPIYIKVHVNILYNVMIRQKNWRDLRPMMTNN